MNGLTSGAQSVPPLHIAVDPSLASEGSLRLFAEFELELAGGQWTCLLGPSGVGKTTLLRAIGGLLGRAPAMRWADQPFQPRGTVAYMAQQDLLLPWLDLAANVALGARLRSQDDGPARARALGLLADVGLADRADDLPATLSGGMRQRVALARTLFEQRALVLMDEPFSQLDAITRLAMQDLARRLLDGRTVLLVTHDPLEALRLADRIVILKGAPASIGAPIFPPGTAPRAFDDPQIAALHRSIMDRLSANGAGL